MKQELVDQLVRDIVRELRKDYSVDKIIQWSKGKNDSAIRDTLLARGFTSAQLSTFASKGH